MTPHGTSSVPGAFWTGHGPLDMLCNKAFGGGRPVFRLPFPNGPADTVPDPRVEPVPAARSSSRPQRALVRKPASPL
jgi:hypothetical protein